MYTLHLKQIFPFASQPPLCTLEGENILVNDYMLPAEIDPACRYNPHNVRLFVIGHEFGAICAVFASCEQYAFDAAVDGNRLDCLMADEQDHDDEGLSALGNAGELFDLSMAWIGEVVFDPARDILLIVALAKASAEGLDNLG